MSNAKGYFYILLIWFSGVDSCLGVQKVHSLYVEAKLCEATQCEKIQQTTDEIKKADLPLLKKNKR